MVMPSMPYVKYADALPWLHTHGLLLRFWGSRLLGMVCCAQPVRFWLVPLCNDRRHDGMLGNLLRLLATFPVPEHPPPSHRFSFARLVNHWARL
jgi:hypothetical protein